MRVPKAAPVQTSTDKNAASEPLIQRNRSVRILAKSIFRELKSQGYDDKQVVALATELLSEVTDKRKPTPRRA